MDWLSGKKTYIVALCVAAISVARYFGYINDEAALMLYGLLGAGGAVTMRAGIAKAEAVAGKVEAAAAKVETVAAKVDTVAVKMEHRSFQG
jgi:hypothetical protein